MDNAFAFVGVIATVSASADSATDDDGERNDDNVEDVDDNNNDDVVVVVNDDGNNEFFDGFNDDGNNIGIVDDAHSKDILEFVMNVACRFSTGAGIFQEPN